VVDGEVEIGHPCNAEARLVAWAIISRGLLGVRAWIRFLLLGLVLPLALRLAAVAARLHVIPAPLPHLAPREGPLAHLADLEGQILLLHPPRHSSSTPPRDSPSHTTPLNFNHTTQRLQTLSDTTTTSPILRDLQTSQVNPTDPTIQKSHTKDDNSETHNIRSHPGSDWRSKVALFREFAPQAMWPVLFLRNADAIAGAAWRLYDSG
jgi:hypothetical protein